MRLIPLSGQTRIINTRTSLFLALNLIDFVVTVVAIRSNLGFEGNPLLRLFPLQSVGLIKIVVALSVIRFLGDRIGVMRFLNIGMGLVVIWNITWLVIMLIMLGV